MPKDILVELDGPLSECDPLEVLFGQELVGESLESVVEFPNEGPVWGRILTGKSKICEELCNSGKSHLASSAGPACLSGVLGEFHVVKWEMMSGVGSKRL